MKNSMSLTNVLVFLGAIKVADIVVLLGEKYFEIQIGRFDIILVGIVLVAHFLVNADES